jgi:hypothetical protein
MTYRHTYPGAPGLAGARRAGGGSLPVTISTLGGFLFSMRRQPKIEDLALRIFSPPVLNFVSRATEECRRALNLPHVRPRITGSKAFYLGNSYASGRF